MIKNILLLAPLLAATAAAADFSYTHLDAGYLHGSAELPSGYFGGGFDDDLDIEGFGVAGRFQITNNFFVYANYENGEIEADVIGDSFDIDTWRLEGGVGAYAGIADCADVYFTVGYKHSDLDFGVFGSQNVGNIDIHVGIRWAPATWLEVNPYVEHSIGVEDDDFVEAVDVTTAGMNVYVTAFQYVQPFVGASIELDSSDENLVSDLVLYTAGLRFSF